MKENCCSREVIFCDKEVIEEEKEEICWSLDKVDLFLVESELFYRYCFCFSFIFLYFVGKIEEFEDFGIELLKDGVIDD